MNNKFKYDPNTTIRFPNIIVKYDDKVANTFFSYVISGDVDTLNKYILENSIPINIKKEQTEKNALHLAIESTLNIKTKLNMIKYLITNHIPVNERDAQGNTPLLVAIQNGDFDVANELLNHKADPSLANLFNISPLHYMASGSIQDCKDVKLESIIEEPSVNNFDQLEINEVSKKTKEVYDKLINDEFTELDFIEQLDSAADARAPAGVAVTNPYPESRFQSYFAHMKYLVDNLENNQDFKEQYDKIKTEYIQKIQKLVTDSTKNINEPQFKSEMNDLRERFFNNFIEIFTDYDRSMFEQIDLNPFKEIPDSKDVEGILIRRRDGSKITKGVDLEHFAIHDKITLNQEIKGKFNLCKQNLEYFADSLLAQTDQYISHVNSFDENILNYGKILQKATLFENIARLKKYTTGGVTFHPFERIDLSGVFNTNDAQFGDALDQTNVNAGGMMDKYDIYRDDAAPDPFNLSVFNGNRNVGGVLGANPTNSYGPNILDNFNYNNYNPFEKKSDSKNEKKSEGQEINLVFSRPISMTFQSNGNPGLLVFPNYQNNLERIIKMQLKYNSFLDVTVTLEFDDGGVLVSKNSVNLKILYIKETAVGNNHNQLINFAVGGANQNALPFLDSRAIQLSFNYTGGEQVYNPPPPGGGAQNFHHMYSPIYAFNSSIKTHFEPLITAIKYTIKDNLKNPAGDNFQNIYTAIKRLIEISIRFQVRYTQFLTSYNEDKVRKRLNKLNYRQQIIRNIYSNDDYLRKTMLEGIELLKFNIEEYIQGTSIPQEINQIIEQFNEIYKLGALHYYWNCQGRICNFTNINQLNNISFDSLKRIYGDNGADINELKSIETITETIGLNIAVPAGANIVTALDDIPQHGIHFNIDAAAAAGADQLDFRQPEPFLLDIPNYFTDSRYRLLQELTLYLFYKYQTVEAIVNLAKAAGVKPVIPDELKPYAELFGKIGAIIAENMGRIPDEHGKPLNLSIIADYVDINLINSIKKIVYTVANEKFVSFVNDPNEQIGKVNPIEFGIAKIDHQSIQLDTPFELDLLDIDSNYKKVIENKFRDAREDIETSLIKILNKGDSLVMEPDFKSIDYDNIDGDDTSNIKEQQIYYSTGFLDQSNSNMCIKFNKALLERMLVISKNTNMSDSYGNTPLMYAIKSNNYLAIQQLVRRRTKILYTNIDGVTPLHFALDKLKGICGYFPDDNLILSVNKSYTISLKEELGNIDVSKNIMKNYDKLVELYLFLYNSKSFENIYAKNYDLLDRFFSTINNLDNTYMKANVKGKRIMLTNPLVQYLTKNKDGSLNKLRKDVPSVLTTNLKFLESELSKINSEIQNLQQKINRADEYINLLDDTMYKPVVNQKRVDLQNEIDDKRGTRNDIRDQIDYVKGQIDSFAKGLDNENRQVMGIGFAKYDDQNMGIIQRNQIRTDDLLKQNARISLLFRDTDLLKDDSSQYLKSLHRMLEDPEYGMSAHNIHSLINKSIKSVIKELEDYLKSSYYELASFDQIKDKINIIITLINKTLSSKISIKNSKSRKIEKNPELKDVFNMMCYSIDQVIAFSFFKVLFRTLSKYFQTTFPKTNDANMENYVTYFDDKVKSILEESSGSLSVKNIILPKYNNLRNINNFSYEASYLTQRMVSVLCGIKLKDMFKEDDIEKPFNLILKLIMNNNVLPIDEKSTIYRYLSKTIIPYFKEYYKISIKTLNNVTSNYENMIQNQFVLLKIIHSLLDNLDEYQIQKLSV